MKTLGLLFCVVAVVLLTALARAEPPKLPLTMRFDYRFDARLEKKCPKVWDLRDIIRDTAQRRPFANRAAAWLSVRISQTGKGIQSHLEMYDGGGNLVWVEDSKPLPLCKDVVEQLGQKIGERLRDTSALAPSPDLPWFVRFDYLPEAGAERCGKERDVKYEFAKSMRWNIFADPKAPVSLVVKVRKKIGGLFEGVVELRTSAGGLLWSYSTVADHCYDVIWSLSFMFTLEFDPAPDYEYDDTPAPAEPASQEVKPPAPAKKRESLPPPSKAELPPPDVEPARPISERVRFEGGLGGALAIRTAPSVYAGDLVGDIGFRWRWFSLDGEIRYSPPAGAEAAGAPSGVRVSASRLTGGLVPCRHVGVFFGCGVVQIGAVFGKASGVVQPMSMTNLIASGGVRLGLETPHWGHFWVRTSLDLLATGPVVELSINQRTQWTMSLFNAALGGGVFANF